MLISSMSNYVGLLLVQYLVSGPMKAPGGLAQSERLPVGYELIVIGLNPVAARYGCIDVGRRLLLASVLAGGLGGLAGTVELMGVQHRLMDGMGGGVGFIGVVVALLARLDPLAVLPTAILYGGMSVGADAMQRTNGIPSSIAAILQSLIVMFVMASDVLRFYRVSRPALWFGTQTPDAVRVEREAAR